MQGHSSTGRPLVLPATLLPLRSNPIRHLRRILPQTERLHSLEAHRVGPAPLSTWRKALSRAKEAYETEHSRQLMQVQPLTVHIAKRSVNCVSQAAPQALTQRCLERRLHSRSSAGGASESSKRRSR